MKIDVNMEILLGGGLPMKVKIKSLVAEAIKKGILAVGKLIKTKLLPKAEEKYCKVLQATSEKLIDKVSDLVEDLADEQDTKKRARKMYLLQLCVNTMEAIAETFDKALETIREVVDFGEIDNDDAKVEIAAAVEEAGGKIVDDYDNYVASLDTGCCGPDGCQIV